MNDDALDRLALAHELRTPLTSALLGIGVLAEGTLGRLDRRQLALLRAVLHDLERLRSIVDAGLDTPLLGRHVGPSERSDLDLAAVVSETIALLRTQAADAEIAVELDARSVMIRVDEVRIAWVVATLVGNALRYARARVQVNVGLDDDEALLVVHDDGPGVPRRTAARLLTREGGGLGLVLAREVIEAHGGSIALESSRRRGTTARVRLPIA